MTARPGVLCERTVVQSYRQTEELTFVNDKARALSFFGARIYFWAQSGRDCFALF
jgi:hypothetical protein